MAIYRIFRWGSLFIFIIAQTIFLIVISIPLAGRHRRGSVLHTYRRAVCIVEEHKYVIAPLLTDQVYTIVGVGGADELRKVSWIARRSGLSAFVIASLIMPLLLLKQGKFCQVFWTSFVILIFCTLLYYRCRENTCSYLLKNAYP